MKKHRNHFFLKLKWRKKLPTMVDCQIKPIYYWAVLLFNVAAAVRWEQTFRRRQTQAFLSHPQTAQAMHTSCFTISNAVSTSGSSPQSLDSIQIYLYNNKPIEKKYHIDFLPRQNYVWIKILCAEKSLKEWITCIPSKEEHFYIICMCTWPEKTRKGK